MTYNIGDPVVKSRIQEQDNLVHQIWVMSSGLSQKLPRSYKAAMKSEAEMEWEKACKKEIKMLESMGVWEEKSLPVGKRVISTKWVFARKTNSAGQVTKHKS